MEVDSAHDILCLLSYHRIQVPVVDMYVCKPELRVKNEGRFTELRNTVVGF